jgi:PKD repeat protein
MLRIVISSFLSFLSFSLFSQAPIANFTASPLQVCEGAVINFTNTSTAGGSPIANYSWDFGDGIPATTVNASHTYASPGTYTITLVATASNGQADAEVKTNYVIVHPKPIANFTTTSAGCTIPYVVNFTNSSTTGAGITYNWNFGNGQTSTVQNPPAQTYASVGSFTSTLTVTNTITGCTKTFSNTIVTNAFSAGITPPATVCVGQSVIINDNSTVGANQWAWNFGNGQTSSLENPTVTYATAGTYTISLTSQNTGSGCTGSTTSSVIVRPLPVVSFTANPTTGCAPVSVAFTNTTAANTNYSWSFGDGTNFTGANPPPHNYTANGTYTVTVIATNSFGCSTTSTQTNLINLYQPTVSMTATPVEGCAPLSVTFTGTGTSPNPATNPIVTYQWLFGDGTTFTGQNPPAHIYPVGIYDVTLTATTQNGCIGTVTNVSYIKVGSIDFIDYSLATSPICAKQNIQFTNLSIINAPHQPSEVTYTWDFGDQSTDFNENPMHSYASDTGFFDVQFIVNFRGCKDTIKKLDIVYIKAPISEFNIPTSLYCNPSSFPINVVFDDLAKIGKLSDNCDMTWKWGDGTSNTFLDDPLIDDANAGDITHNYTAYGTYTITQVVNNTTTGCIDSTNKVIHISSINANLSISNDSVCENSNLFLTQSSTSFAAHPLSNWTYSMGNGSIVNGTPNGTYAYPNSGIYTITLTATNSVGCFDTESISNVHVLEPPIADFTTNDSAGCAPFLVLFDNNSLVAGNGAPLSSFSWNYGDAASIVTTNNVSVNPTHSFLTQGVFTVKLVATDAFGCISKTDSLHIRTTKPNAIFTAPIVQCDSINFVTINASTGDVPLAYVWQVDGVNNGTTSSFSRVFNETDNQPTGVVNHTISLIVTDVNGCKDTLASNLDISIPYANYTTVFSGAATNGSGQYTCPPVFAAYTNTSTSFGTISTSTWNFDNNTSSTLTSPSNTFVFPGTYSPTLTITNQYGCKDDTTYADLLTINGPSANPQVLQSADSCGLLVGFNLADTVDIDAVTWTFGDGTTLNNSITTQHLYSGAGSYTASVLVADKLGCEVLYPLPNVVLFGNGILANFTADPLEIKLAETVQFTDLSSNPTPITTWIWSFGDGQSDTTSFSSNPLHYYSLGGNLPVILTVYDANGCKDKDTLYINVKNEFDLPNILTTDNDGINEFFVIKSDIFQSFDIVVTNRWGNIMHDAKDQKGKLIWNGKTDGGDKVIDGVYFYKLTATLLNNEKIVRNGFITVVAN